MEHKPEHGKRICKHCNEPYIYPFEGGYKYHHECAKEAKRAQDSLYSSLKTSTKTDRHREYFWPWACGTCGIKYEIRKDARECCRGTWDDVLLAPVYKEGGFWYRLGQIEKDLELERAQERKNRMDSRSHDTSPVPSSAALAAATSG